MDPRADSPGEAFNPYQAPRAPIGREALDANRPLGPEEELTVTHDLTDRELRRFVNFDVYYDPKPMFGFLPQWIFVASMGVPAGWFIAAAVLRSVASMILGGLLLPASYLAVSDLRAAARRRQARALGLCDGRIVTIGPEGLFVLVPGAQPSSMVGIGPMSLTWREIQRITVSEDDLTFWLKPSLRDVEGRVRIVVPLRAFAGTADAAAFETAASAWHAAANGDGSADWSKTGR